MKNNIRYWRKKRGYTMRKLAEASGVHHVSICKYETGKTVPSVRSLVRIASALGCSVEDLLAVEQEAS